MYLVDVWNGEKSQWGREIQKVTSRRSRESFHIDTSKIMSRNQEKVNIMPQRGTGFMVGLENEAPTYIQASVRNTFKIFNKYNGHTLSYYF